MNNDIYTFGKCEECGEDKPLKNDLCNNCNNKNFPDILKDLFRKKDDHDS
jgi:hypothetical protein